MANQWAIKKTVAELVLICIALGAQGLRAEGLIAITDFNQWDSNVFLHWEKAEYQGLNIAGDGNVHIPFGVSLPTGYSAAGSQKYPLVLYLHGAGAIGTGNQALQRATPRYFARTAQNDANNYNAFVLAPQANNKWVDTSYSGGPYHQDGNTYTENMHMVENILSYLSDSGNNAALNSVLGVDAADIDANRIYVVGDSMGAYGTWDIVGRNPGLFAAAMAAAGSGPNNKLPELRQTPFWTMHAVTDGTCPNYLPDSNDPDGGGSLGMLAMLDLGFDANTNIFSSAVFLDDPNTPAGPAVTDELIYSEFPSPPYDHGIAPSWTSDLKTDFKPWLFGQAVPEPAAMLLLVLGGGAIIFRRR